MFRSINTGTIPSVGSTDGYKWSYRAFLWLGLGSMLSFNFFITADPYFRSKLHNESATTNGSMSSLEQIYENALLLSAAIPHLITTIALTFFVFPFTHKRRIYTSSFGIILCLLFIFILAFIHVQQWLEIFFGMMMIVVLILSVLGAVLLNSFFSIVSTLPSRYVHGFVCGQSLGGVFIVLCSIISITVSGEMNISNAIYFCFGMIIFLINVFVYKYLEKLPLFQIYSTSFQQRNDEDEPLLQSSSSFHDENDELYDFFRLTQRQRLKIVSKSTKWNFLSIFLTCTVTFTVFPAYLSKIQPAYPTTDHLSTLWSEKLYTPVLSYLLFHLGDTLGRIIPYKYQYPSLNSKRSLCVIAACRSIFILLFGFCHFPGTRTLPYLIRNDFIYAILVLTFAISHGYTFALNMLYAPRRVHMQLNSLVGAFMFLAMTSGICLGALFSFGLVKLYGIQELNK